MSLHPDIQQAINLAVREVNAFFKANPNADKFMLVRTLEFNKSVKGHWVIISLKKYGYDAVCINDSIKVTRIDYF